MWWLGQSPNHHVYGTLLRASGFFITLLDSVNWIHRTLRGEEADG